MVSSIVLILCAFGSNRKSLWGNLLLLVGMLTAWQMGERKSVLYVALGVFINGFGFSFAFNVTPEIMQLAEKRGVYDKAALVK